MKKREERCAGKERGAAGAGAARGCISIRSDVNFDKRTHMIIVIISNIPGCRGKGVARQVEKREEGHL